MRVRILGAGPAGLLFALLAKRRQPHWDIRVFEQTAPDATLGFGVVFSEGGLAFLERDAPDLHRALATRMESWPMQRIVHRDQRVDIDGNGFASIARIELNQLLQASCREAGVVVEFRRAVQDLAELGDADLIVGGDGLNSLVRRTFETQFQPRVEWLINKFAWYGVARPFECLSLTFRANEHGAFVAHHHRYAPATIFGAIRAGVVPVLVNTLSTADLVAYYAFESYDLRVLDIREDDIVFSPPKIFFAYGFGNSCTFPFSVGATAVLHPGRPDPDGVYGAIERHRPTVLFGLPTLYTGLIAVPGSEQRDLTSLRPCLSAAEVLSGDVFREWQRRTGLAIVEGLGSTEVLHIYLSNRLDRQVPGASGARVPGYDLKLTDVDGTPVARAESGILWVRGDSQAPLYWNRADKTADAIRDGWIWTGDRFREDAEGFFTFEGRADDFVKVSGQWVTPVEVERCLAEHPAVRECAVLAVEDAQRITTLKAWVVPVTGAGDAEMTRTLQTFVKQRLLPYEYPRVIDYVTELPKTGTGKIDRQALKRGG